MAATIDRMGERMAAGAGLPVERAVAERPRAGLLACLCPPLVAGGGSLSGGGLLVAGAVFAGLAQVLVGGSLALAGTMVAAGATAAALPMVAYMGGAVVATLPGAMIFDAFGRRAALATGAGLGVAGGVVAATGLVLGALGFVVLGAFWLGIAQGFAMFYRHAAAAAGHPELRRRLIAAVLGAGVVAGVAAPTLSAVAESVAAPFTLVGTLAAGAIANLVALVAALVLPSDPALAAPAATTRGSSRPAIGATAAAAGAWAVMAAVMAHGPVMLVDCGVATATAFGFVAWHVVAMHAPAGIVAATGLAPAPRRATGLGLGLLVASAAALVAFGQETGAAVALVLSGAGWSLATFGATTALHADGPPGRLALALHDGALLGAAFLGALFGGGVMDRLAQLLL